MSETEGPPSPKKRHVAKESGYSRHRTGCLTCRRRKKKCDLAPNRCGHCQRLNLTCHWEAPRDTLVRSSKITLPSIHPARTQMAVFQHSSIPRAPDPMQFWVETDQNGPGKALNRRLALRYYMETFTSILTTNLENNGFLSVLLPMAMESPPLLDTVIAWSSSHLSLCHDAYRIGALEDRSSALTSFASSFSTGSLSYELSLAGCLVLCSMESIMGDTAGWFEHLVGAAQIIQSALADKSGRPGADFLHTTLEGRWLLRNFAYHDILMSVTLDREPLLAGQYWMAEGDSVVDSYFGLASLPMALLSEISTLNADIKKSATYEVSQDSCNECIDTLARQSASFKEFSSRAFSIESRLQDWTCGFSPDASLMHQAETYRSAALIYLYRTIRRHFPSMTVVLNKKIARQVDEVVRHVAGMPLGCLPECTLLFPVFLAGGEADGESHIQQVRSRMLGMTSYRRFQNVNTALSVLEELWQKNASGTAIDVERPIDWLDILDRRGWKLALS